MAKKLFDVGELLEAARTRAELSDFGPPDFMEGLEIMINGFNTDVVVPADRVEPFRENIIRLLSNRLWFEKDLTDHPEILDEEIKSPIIITSLPRTGSTKLQRLLGSSGDFQTASLWRNHMFARIPGLPDGGRERRIAETRAYEKWIYEVSPEMITGHPIFTDEPEEEFMLMLHSFRSISVTLFGSASQNNWAFTADPGAAYDYLKKQLQYLQWQLPEHREKPWLLKTPVHHGVEGQLCRVFRNPRFIVTHRDPVKVVPSVTNITQNWVVVYTKPDGIGASAAMMSEMCANQARNHMAWRDGVSDVQIVDVSFREINAEGLDIARKIYGALGMTLAPDAEKAMQQWDERNPREKHGKHSYSTAVMGTSDEAIRADFADYIERYGKFFR